MLLSASFKDLAILFSHFCVLPQILKRSQVPIHIYHGLFHTSSHSEQRQQQQWPFLFWLHSLCFTTSTPFPISLSYILRLINTTTTLRFHSLLLSLSGSLPFSLVFFRFQSFVCDLRSENMRDRLQESLSAHRNELVSLLSRFLSLSLSLSLSLCALKLIMKLMAWLRNLGFGIAF